MSSRRRRSQRRHGADRRGVGSVNPEPFFGGPQAVHRHHLKTLQLCKQVQHAVEDGLAASMDEVLQSLMVVSVEPAPSSGRMMVAVAAPFAEVSMTPDELLALVERSKGDLRAEVGAQIHRKRVPELVFRVAAPWEVRP